nr:MAG TPA: hypothetical protein [Caudoviricetes sp.]DAM99723.1 MAG TPA: hypothetical protein [Caudoviricetes sp.]DAN02732.1 MAG TPA: hypothetical protein [Caudoviricetes sp.]DAN32370.1 MAG TPA: hypothetical protein [Caudoviricetes sp.]DAZ08189.1 MAG TPA: hypothetical protein [Caudoviricetes sp.]
MVACDLILSHLLFYVNIKYLVFLYHMLFCIKREQFYLPSSDFTFFQAS